MVKNKFAQIILGAGRPLHGQKNASLNKVSSNARVLDWILNAAKSLNPEVHFVAGYQIDEVISRYPDLNYSINTDWLNTGPIDSLLKARVSEHAECIVSYSDIVYHEQTVTELVKLGADVGIAVDTKWQDRYPNRSAEDINRSEKTVISDGHVIAAGSNLSSQVANAEFIGLMTLKPKVINFLANNPELFSPDMRRANLTDLIEFLRNRGLNIMALDVEGDWAELNEPHDLASFILGTKAQSLKRLEGIVTRSKIAPQVSFTVADWNTNSDEIIQCIQEKFGLKKIIVRSSALSEDGFDSSNAGAYASYLNIDANVREDIWDAINSVIGSYADGNLSNQILVQPMIEKVLGSGVVFTRTLSESAPYYVVNYDDLSQKTDTITSGTSVDHKTLVISRCKALDLENTIPNGLNGLIPAVMEIESLLDFNALDVEFAIDAERQVNILQVRPLTSAKHQIDIDDIVFDSIESSIRKFQSLQKNSAFVVGSCAIFGVMPDWNPAEIIGTKPYCLSFDLYRYLVSDEVWATQRAEYGYRDVRPQPLIVSFSGHPYVDVRASFNSFIPANLNNELAGRLVDYYLLRLRENPHYHDKIEFEVLPTCYTLNFENWRARLADGGFSNDDINMLEDGLRTITENAISRTQGDLKTVEIFEKRFGAIFSSNLPPLEKALSLLEDCRRYGTLVFAHLARSAFVSVSLLKSAVEKKVISQEAMDSFLNSIETVAHEFINDAKKVSDGELSWPSFISRYGHLRPGTYEITSESYSDNVEKFLKPVVAQAGTSTRIPTFKNFKWTNERKYFSDALSETGITTDVDTVEKFLRGAIEGREYAKFIFSRNLSAALELISEYGKTHGLSRKQMANVSLGTLFALRSGSISTEDTSKLLMNESNSYLSFHDKAKKIELPPLITDESDFSIFIHPSSEPNYVGSGRVLSEIITLSSGITDIDESALNQKILLISHADPGFDWIFGYDIAGLVTMYGGGNSHMAIRASEFGLPAAIGVGQSLFEKLRAASFIELDVTNRKIEVIR